ncbi:hypothetical protein [Candidatus Enterococcus mansonii]|uniref:Uncharacterized protein n=1 Tax=Candidatus Enterococcus mansonii TaxID=1834181 RepID=A0A242CF56_9ENTE|nr:hypothetical protein [Enterococcus sp. 4G2_DIV0659]OTO08412.1 hypothetical protein A5880_001412 [Enterococcus sp. 4G2_DIV0659]
MKNKTVPLLKIASDKSIYFDLSTQELFIQEFEGPFTEKAGGSYSKSTTWSISMLGGMVIIPLLAKQFKFVSFMPIYLTVLYISGASWFLGKFLANILVEKSKGQITKRIFKKEEVVKVLKNSKNLIPLAWLERLFFVGYIVFFLFSLSMEDISTEIAIELILFCFGIGLIHYSVHPLRQRKAFRILKRQLKAGKFDEQYMTETD